MSDTGSDAFLGPPGRKPVEERSGDDPVSWLQIEQGWSVVTADGTELGSVAQVAGTQQDDIFDGLAVKVAGSSEPVYVPGEQVSTIYPGRVTLKLDASRAKELPAYREAARHETLRPRPETLASRAGRWFRGR